LAQEVADALWHQRLNVTAIDRSGWWPDVLQLPDTSGKVRRLIWSVLFAAAVGCAISSVACNRRGPVRLQETDEGGFEISSTVHMSDPRAAIQLLKGFHGVEQNAWRWTMGTFSVTLKPPAGAKEKGATLNMKFTLPDAVMARVKSTTITAAVAGKQVGAQTYNTAGEYTFTADVPGPLFISDALTVDFALTHFLPAGTADSRELGLVASTIGLEPK
jgi:hypothetical protein